LAYALQADPILSGEKFYVSDDAGDIDGTRPGISYRDGLIYDPISVLPQPGMA
jgi:hypothetical protein